MKILSRIMNIPTESVSYASFAIIALSTIPSILNLTKKRRTKPANNGKIYEDAGGVATEESMARFSTQHFYVIALILNTLGIATSLTLAVYSTVLRDQIPSAICLTQLWLLFGSWIFTLIQIVRTSLETDPVTRFNQGAFNLLSCCFIIILAALVLFGEVPGSAVEIVVYALTAAQIIEVTAIAWVLFLVPRRPDIYRPNGQLVERQHSSSLWQRAVFSWCIEILDQAAETPPEITDLPAPDVKIRSKEATVWFRAVGLKDTVQLWILILWALRWRTIWQWTLIIISNFFDVGPQFAMLRLLQFLEARERYDPVDPKAWFWVLVLFLITGGSAIIDYRLMWSMYSDIAIPVRSILTTLIFEKMMRLKDIKEPTSSEEETETASGDGSTEPSSTDATNKSTRRTQQDIVNIFAVDTNLVAVFAGQSQMYPNFVARVILAVIFLWLLVGWQSMVAGMLSMALTFPITRYLGSKYAGYQKALMKARDKKTGIITEALNGIRQIKFSAIETQWAQKIDEVRENELTELWRSKFSTVIMGIASDLTPVLFAVFALATYTYIYGDLLPSVAFTALSLFISLESLTAMLPFLIVTGLNAKVSCDRIDEFLQSPERVQNTHPGESVSFYKTSLSFPTHSKDPDEDRFILRDITLDFPNGALSVISGPTGSGKSLLLGAILGEAEVLSGYIRAPRPPPIYERFDAKATAANWILPTAIAYISQTPWIENATIRDNILFGLPFESIRYEKVINACALSKDLAMFDDGDSTEVGAQGISLSGGQKWRLTLARAFYSRAGILILDDVFSALDAHVGKEIYDNALMGELSEGRTRILVTHHVSLCLPGAKYAVRLGARGTLEHAGLVEELRKTGSFDEILKAENEADASVAAEDAGSSGTTLRDEVQGSVAVVEDTPIIPKTTPKKLIEDEARETGSVKKGVYLEYFNATGGIPAWAVVLFAYIVAETFNLGHSWWVKIWTSSYEHSQETVTRLSHGYTMQTTLLIPPKPYSLVPAAVSVTNHTLLYYLGIYVAISLSSILISAIRSYLVFRGGLTGSRRVFKEMTESILRTPLRWLDTVPTGRILNRFTADFQSMDSQLSSNIAGVALHVLSMIGTLVAACLISPYIFILSVVLLAICAQMGRIYLRGARSLKRLESIQKSPLISLFSSSLEGISTIRAFSKSPAFITRIELLIDNFATSTFYNWLFNMWLSFRMGMIGSIFSSAVAAFIVSTRGIDSSLAGFALAFALDFRWNASRTVRFLSTMELDMNSAERIFEYSHLSTEAQGGIDNLRASWPEEGKLEVKDLEVGYAEGLPSILKGLSFKVDMNQRIGVVGRTGAGKSTLSLAIFRFLEARRGSITIDGIDISTIKLHDLRTRLAIIPQDPVLFSGTIRSNLDPFDEFSDHQIREALARVHLTPSVDSTPAPELASSSTSSTVVDGDTKGNANIFLSLSSPISSGGSNLSHGQKQLLCLARAIFSRPRLLLLDEATSAVDMMTDALIQRSIREEFANTTLLVVAHRLSTVVDFDRILVMRDGIAAEFGTPKELLEKEDGVFKGMVAQSGEKEELERSILGA